MNRLSWVQISLLMIAPALPWSLLSTVSGLTTQLGTILAHLLSFKNRRHHPLGLSPRPLLMCVTDRRVSSTQVDTSRDLDVYTRIYI